jgi:hypothetical protein
MIKFVLHAYLHEEEGPLDDEMPAWLSSSGASYIFENSKIVFVGFKEKPIFKNTVNDASY